MSVVTLLCSDDKRVASGPLCPSYVEPRWLVHLCSSSVPVSALSSGNRVALEKLCSSTVAPTSARIRQRATCSATNVMHVFTRDDMEERKTAVVFS